ncbi:MAG: hypothetical protein J6Y71_02570 [Ruminococcus sp.]|nr:hypothetical protein [Ruminococcus sp.]
MTEKELRKAKKEELIEMLYYLRKEIDELKEENDKLRAKIISLSESNTKSQEKQTETEAQDVPEIQEVHDA